MHTFFQKSTSILSNFSMLRKKAVVFDIDTLISNRKHYIGMGSDLRSYYEIKARIKEKVDIGYYSSHEGDKEMQTLYSNFIEPHPWIVFRSSLAKNLTLDELHLAAEKFPEVTSIISSAKPTASIIQSLLNGQKNVGILQNRDEMSELVNFLLIRNGLTETEARTIPKFLNYDWMSSKRNGLTKAQDHFKISREEDILFVTYDNEAIADIEQEIIDKSFYRAFIVGEGYSGLNMTDDNKSLVEIHKFLKFYPRLSCEKNENQPEEINRVRFN